MKAVILYYSRYGNTERIAKSLESGLRQAGALRMSLLPARM
jgi:flavodoxin